MPFGVRGSAQGRPTQTASLQRGACCCCIVNTVESHATSVAFIIRLCRRGIARPSCSSWPATTRPTTIRPTRGIRPAAARAANVISPSGSGTTSQRRCRREMGRPLPTITRSRLSCGGSRIPFLLGRSSSSNRSNPHRAASRSLSTSGRTVTRWKSGGGTPRMTPKQPRTSTLRLRPSVRTTRCDEPRVLHHGGNRDQLRRLHRGGD